MKIDFGPFGRIFACPTVLVDEHLRFCTEKQLKVLLCILREAKDEPDTQEISKKLSITEADVEDAIRYWEENQFFEVKEKIENECGPHNCKEKKEERTDDRQRIITVRDRSHLSPGEINELIDHEEQFKILVQQFEYCSGNALSPTGKEILGYLYQLLNCSPEYILLVTGYCKTINKMALPYIEKTIVGWLNDGIDSYDKAEERIKFLGRQNDAIKTEREITGIRDRAPSEKEKAFVTKWIMEEGLPENLLKYCYDKTVDTTGKLSFSYMDGILKKWKEKGFRTLEDVKKEENERKNQYTKQGETSFDISAAMIQMEKNLEE